VTNELIVVASGQEMGLVRRNQKGKLDFTYNKKWAAEEDSYPLSLSMPLGRGAWPREDRSFSLGTAPGQ